MPRKIRERKTDLRRSVFEQVPTKSSHTRWRHPLLRGETLTLSGGDGQDAKPYQEQDLRAILTKLRRIREGQP